MQVTSLIKSPIYSIGSAIRKVNAAYQINSNNATNTFAKKEDSLYNNFKNGLPSPSSKIDTFTYSGYNLYNNKLTKSFDKTHSKSYTSNYFNSVASAKTINAAYNYTKPK